MTNNIDRAFYVIHDTVQEWPQDDVAGVATQRLADAGLLAPDLPEANDPTASFVPGGKGWLLQGPTVPVVWTAPGGLVMIQQIEPGDLTPEKARALAYALLAAANHAKEGNHE